MKTPSLALTGLVLVAFLLLNACGGGASGTSTGALQVVSSNIRDGQTRVDTGTTLTVDFSAPVDPATVNVGSFLLDGPAGRLGGTVSVNPAGTAATFTPDAPLPNRADLVATLTTAIRATTGEALSAEHRIRFSTAPWTHQEGTTADDVARAVVADAAGNLYVAGYTTGALNGQNSQGGRDIVVIKHDARGRVLWTRQYGTAGDDEAAAMVLDAAGHLHVAGTTAGAFPGQTSAGGTDAVILTLDTSGNLLGTVQFGTDGDDTARALAIDSSGNLVVAGQTTGAFTGFTAAGGTDAFILALNPQGILLWTDQVGSNGQDEGTALATDGNGNVYLAGSTGGSLDGNTTDFSFNDVFLAAYDTGGTRNWLQQLRTLPPDTAPTLTSESARGLAIDAGGNLYIAGDRLNVLANTTRLDMLLIKCDNRGTPLWADTFGTVDDDRLNAIVIDAQGNLYATGQTMGDLSGTNAGFDDIVTLKRDTNGNALWTRQTGSAAGDLANALALTSHGDVVAAGQAGGGLDGNAALGGSDMLLLRYAADGTLY